MVGDGARRTFSGLGLIPIGLAPAVDCRWAWPGGRPGCGCYAVAIYDQRRGADWCPFCRILRTLSPGHRQWTSLPSRDVDLAQISRFEPEPLTAESYIFRDLWHMVT